MTPFQALEKAIRVLGGPSKMASDLSESMGERVTQNQVSMWKIRSQRLPEKYAIHVQILTAAKGEIVYAHELCPQLIPPGSRVDLISGCLDHKEAS